jgi:hypothetical protein
MGFKFLFLFYFFLSILSTLPSSSSHPYSPLHSSSFCAKLHCSPSQLLFLPFLLHSQLPPSPSPPILPQPVSRIPLPPTHSPPADQPTTPILHNPNSLQYLIQAPYTTTTEIYPNTYKCHKTQQPLYDFPHSPTPLPSSPFSATLTKFTPQISIASLINVNPLTPTAYRYYHCGVFYIYNIKTTGWVMNL